jgi:hypothetical protein
MNRIKQRTSVVVAALAVLIGGGAALQALAAGPDAVRQPGGRVRRRRCGHGGLR